MFIDQSELESSVFLTMQLYKSQNLEVITTKLKMPNTDRRRVQKVVHKLGVWSGQVPKRPQSKANQIQKKKRKEAGKVSPRFMELMVTWGPTSTQQKVDFLNDIRARDRVKEQPELIVGKPIVMPASAYFPETAETLAQAASIDAADAKAQAAKATVGRAVLRFVLAKRQKTVNNSSVGPSKELAAPTTPPIGPDDIISLKRPCENAAEKEESPAAKRTRVQ